MEEGSNQKPLRRGVAVVVALVLCVLHAGAQVGNAIVVDSATLMPVAGASVFGRDGKVIGSCNAKGRLPYIPAGSYPLTVRYLGFEEQVVPTADADTVFLRETFAELPEVVVESRRHKVLHMLAYVREYSTLSTYTDTVFLFREKMVDYMLVPDRNVRFKGWSSPRVLKCKSYYRFTNAHGLDSVSDKCSHHFSWSDWVGIADAPRLPMRLRREGYATDTIRGKYSPAELWMRNNDRVAVDVNVLADTASRKWVPNLSAFFRNRLDFEKFRIRFNYGNVAGDSISPVDLTGYSFNIESNGRGHDMFMFHRVNEPFFVSTYAEVYILDREYITVKEARKWERRKVYADDIAIYEAADAPELQPSVQQLVDRVNSVDIDKVRTDIAPDTRLVSRKVVRQHFGQRVLQIFKTITGISHVRMNRNLEHHWRDFSDEQIRRNKIRNKNADNEQR